MHSRTAKLTSLTYHFGDLPTYGLGDDESYEAVRKILTAVRNLRESGARLYDGTENVVETAVARPNMLPFLRALVDSVDEDRARADMQDAIRNTIGVFNIFDGARLEYLPFLLQYAAPNRLWQPWKLTQAPLDVVHELWDKELIERDAATDDQFLNDIADMPLGDDNHRTVMWLFARYIPSPCRQLKRILYDWSPANAELVLRLGDYSSEEVFDVLRTRITTRAPNINLALTFLLLRRGATQQVRTRSVASKLSGVVPTAWAPDAEALLEDTWSQESVQNNIASARILLRMRPTSESGGTHISELPKDVMLRTIGLASLEACSDPQSVPLHSALETQMFLRWLIKRLDPHTTLPWRPMRDLCKWFIWM